MSNDDELRVKLTELGVDVGPITSSTREFYKRLLRKRTNELQASTLGSAAKKHKPAPATSPTVTKLPKKKPISTKRRSDGSKVTPKAQNPAVGKESRALKPATAVTPWFVPQEPNPPPNPYSRPVPPSPSLYPKLPPLSSDPLLQPPPSTSCLVPQHKDDPCDDRYGPSLSPVASNIQKTDSGRGTSLSPVASKTQKTNSGHGPPRSPPLASNTQRRSYGHSPYIPSHSPTASIRQRSDSSLDYYGPSLSPVASDVQRRYSDYDDSGSSPPSHSPHQTSSSTSTNSSSIVTTVTNWLGARVKNIIGRLQEVASPSPRRPLSRTPATASPSPSAPSRMSSFGEKSYVSEDSVSVNELDFFDGPGDVYLHVPAQHDSKSSHLLHRHAGDSSDRYDWELLPSDVEICKRADGKLWLLGKGGCGQVYRGLKDRVDDVAVKVIRLQVSDPRSTLAQFKQEIDTICKLRHRHIVQFYGACIQPSCLFMVTELMDTDLFSALRKGSEYTWDGKHGSEVLTGIASGLNYLHSRRPPIVHRDIKSPNILVMNGLAKIADVGIAHTMAATDMTAQRGFTVAWAAPEVILRKRANEKIDIWGFGIILWEVVTGSIPRPGQLVFPPQAPGHLRSLYTRCTSDSAGSRPTAAEIIRALKDQ